LTIVTIYSFINPEAAGIFDHNIRMDAGTRSRFKLYR